MTADGSMDCSKHPEEQESRMAHLIFCETVAAFLLLKPKGNFILKTFTTLEHRTVCLMYLLVCVFNEVCGCYIQVQWKSVEDDMNVLFSPYNTFAFKYSPLLLLISDVAH